MATPNQPLYSQVQADMAVHMLNSVMAHNDHLDEVFRGYRSTASLLVGMGSAGAIGILAFLAQAKSIPLQLEWAGSICSVLLSFSAFCAGLTFRSHLWESKGNLMWNWLRNADGTYLTALETKDTKTQVLRQAWVMSVSAEANAEQLQKIHFWLNLAIWSAILAAPVGYGTLIIAGQITAS